MAQQFGNVALYLSIVNLIYTVGSAILITGAILGSVYDYCWDNPADDEQDIYCKSFIVLCVGGPKAPAVPL